MNIVNWAIENKTMLLGVAFCISEALAFIPSVESNGIFQAIFNFLKKANTAK